MGREGGDPEPRTRMLPSLSRLADTGGWWRSGGDPLFVIAFDFDKCGRVFHKQFESKDDEKNKGSLALVEYLKDKAAVKAAEAKAPVRWKLVSFSNWQTEHAERLCHDGEKKSINNLYRLQSLFQSEYGIEMTVDEQYIANDFYKQFNYENGKLITEEGKMRAALIEARDKHGKVALQKAVCRHYGGRSDVTVFFLDDAFSNLPTADERDALGKKYSVVVNSIQFSPMIWPNPPLVNRDNAAW